MSDRRTLQDSRDIIDEQGNARKGQEQGRFARTLGFTAICLGYFMVILDTTVVYIALPAIQRQFSATITELQWVVDGYTLVFASLLLTAGALGDRLGDKKIFLLGLVLFTGGSALCGIAPTMWMLQLARVVQGIGAALQVPASLALLNHMYSDPRERARAIGIWGGIAGIAAGLGPVLSGLLVVSLGWRSVFFINVPIGMLAILFTLLYVYPVPGQHGRGLDFSAQLMGIVALVLLTLALIEGKTWGWTSLPIVGAFVGFVAATGVFLLIERAAASPMLPLKLFSSRTFSSANTVGLLLNFGFYGQLFLLTAYFQQIRGYSALLAGLALLPQLGMAAFASTLAGRVTGRVGPRLVMVSGLLLGGVGFLALISIGMTTGYLLLCPMLVAIGFGTAFAMPAMTNAVVASAPKERSGIASAVLNASRQTGGTLGVALLGSLVGGYRAFIPGLHSALGIAGGAFLLGSILSFLFVYRGQTNMEVI